MSIFTPQEVYVPRMPEFQKVWEEHERAHWIPDAADMRVDVEQWKTGVIPDDQKAFIKMILRLFTQSDTDVAASYINRLLPMFGDLDVRMTLLSFAAREATHVKGYKRLNDTLGYDSEAFCSEFLQFEAMKAKHDFLMEDVDLSTPSGKAAYLVRQVHAEGTSLFGSFAMLLSFAQAGKLPGMVSVNKWSIAEEGMHARTIAMLFREVVKEHPEIPTDEFKRAAYDVQRRVTAMEDAFIDLCHSVGRGEGATAQQFKDFIRYVGDYRMVQMGFKGQYGITQNPIPWIDYITGNTFANFFEATSVEYSKDAMVGSYTYSTVSEDEISKGLGLV